MCIDPANGPALLADDDLSDEASHIGSVVETGVFPMEVYRHLLTYLSIADTAKFTQLSRTMAGAVQMAAVSDVFLLLQTASDSVGVEAAIDAMPSMPLRERLVLLYAMIGWLIENDPMTSGLDAKRLSSALEAAWVSLSKEANIDYQNEGKQLYLLAKSVLLTHRLSFRCKTDLPPLLEKINDMPVRYRPKILEALSAGVWFLGTARTYQSWSSDFGRRRYSFDASYQRLLDQSDGLRRPISLPTLSAMAMVMLLNPACANVQETLSQRCGLSTFAEQACLEARVVAELVLRIPYHPIPLDAVLSRWSEDSNGIRRLLHDALALNLVGRRGRNDGGWEFWDTTTFPRRQREAASECVLGMPEDAIPGFSDLGPMAMRFWELMWADEIAFPNPQDQLSAILEMPWQLQPSLFTELMQRLDAHTLRDFDIDAWASQRMDQCIAHGHFAAALCALLAPFACACAYLRTAKTRTSTEEGERDRALTLRTVHKAAVERIPESHRGPLIEAMALVLSVEVQDGAWPREKDVLTFLKAFIGDPTSFNVKPMEETAFGGYFGKIWESVPDQATETQSRFEVFCERMNIVSEWRDDIRIDIRITMAEKIRLNEISEEDAAIQLAGLSAAS